MSRSDDGADFSFPYFNPRSESWDESTAEYFDEWTIYDVADPRWTSKGCDYPLCAYEGGCRYRRREVADLNRNLTAGWRWGAWAGHTYESDPTTSYVNMALHYSRRALLTFADGSYYDNVYLRANYNPLGPGYVGDDGGLRAGVNLWAYRELLKRTAIMQHEIGRPNTLLYAHMTNVNIVPILSWASVTLDWEWRMTGGLQFEDQQTRDQIGCDSHGSHCNSSAFILAQTAGGQAGVVPVAIDEGGQYGPTCASRPDLGEGVNCTGWLLRTKYAVTIPHEVRPMGGSWMCGPAGVPASPNGDYEAAPCPTALPGILLDFGYSNPLCDVYRYFEDDLAGLMRTSGVELLPLLVRCPRNNTSRTTAGSDSARALVFLGSFGPGGIVNVQLDASSLSLASEPAGYDAETHKPVLIVTRSARMEHRWLNFSVRLDQHSFRVVVIE